MFKFNRILVLTGALVAAMNPAVLMAADTSQGTLQLTGSVPEVFSIQVRGVPGDLDLSPGVIVNDRLLGILHIRRNMDYASFTVTSDSATGFPYNGAGDAPMTAFSVKLPACTGVDPAAIAAAGLVAPGTDAILGAYVPLVTGSEVDCDLTGSWTTSAVGFPLAGKFGLTLTIVMVST